MSTATIVIHPTYAKIESESKLPLRAIQMVTSWEVDGAQFSPSYRKKLWDGRTHLFKKATKSFPAGMVPAVQQVLEDHGFTVRINDTREDPGARTLYPGSYDLEGISMTGKYSYQMDACVAAVEKARGILKLPTSAGKCFAAGTPVLMFDGTIKNIEDIVPGDEVIGPDGFERVVDTITSGEEEMFTICPKLKGNCISYTVNGSHELSLYILPGHDDLQIDVAGVTAWPEQICKVRAIDYYLFATDYVKENRARLWKPKYLDFHEDMSDIRSLDPFTFGQLITAKRPPKWLQHGARVARYGITSYRDAYIPVEYFRAPVSARQQLIVGVFEGNKFQAKTRRGISVRVYNPRLACDLRRLISSVGLNANIREEVFVDDLKGDRYTTWYVSMSGSETNNLPWTDKNIKFHVRPEGFSHSTKFSFTIERAGKGTYYGFTLKPQPKVKDPKLEKLFLLEDLQVVHNTEIMAAVINRVQLQTLVVVPSRELMIQTHKRFLERLPGADSEKIGVIGDGKWQPGSWVTVAIVDTLASRLHEEECRDFLAKCEVMFLDEAHRTGSDSWYDVTNQCPAYYRIACSATPLDRTDGANLRLIAATGEQIYEIPMKELVDRGVVPTADIIIDKVTAPKLPPKMRYQTAYKQGVVENEHLLEKVLEWTKYSFELGIPTVIMVDEIAHGELIDQELWNIEGAFIPHLFIHGSESTEVRQSAIEQFESGELPVLITSRILDEGVSINNIGMLIMAGSRKSKIKSYQRLGRGLRGTKLIAVDFAHMEQKYLLQHSLTRLQDYKALGCFPIHSSGPDKALLKELWEKPTTVT